jgi:hypothetical protein
MKAAVDLDLDFTMVNVFPGWETMCGSWAETLDMTPDLVVETGSRLWSTEGLTYSPERHLDLLGFTESHMELLGFTNDQKLTLVSALQDFYQWLAAGNAVYDDVSPFMAWAKSCDDVESTGIITFGEMAFQTRKMMSLDLPATTFTPIIFTEVHGRKARRLVAHHGRSQIVVLVDDNAGEHEIAAEHFPSVRRVQILRDPSATFSPAAQWQIRGLMEIPDLLPQILAG